MNLREVIEISLKGYDCSTWSGVSAAADEVMTALEKSHPGWLVTGGEVYKIVETDWVDNDGETQTITVYTDPEPEEGGLDE